jgi:hypothetical protein
MRMVCYIQLGVTAIRASFLRNIFYPGAATEPKPGNFANANTADDAHGRKDGFTPATETKPVNFADAKNAVLDAHARINTVRM